MWFNTRMPDPQENFTDLSPDTLLDAVESQGYEPSGHLLALNSYENRVYQIGLADHGFIIAKFYRPGRWPNAAILEEHSFSLELAEQEIPVVAPLPNGQGDTLLHYEGFRFALFPRQGGRWPELDNPDNLERIGRFLGRIHAVGKSQPFHHRPTLDIDSFGTRSFHYLMEGGFIPAHLQIAYRTLVEDLLEAIQSGYERTGDIAYIRTHGDCHPGNILWTEDGPHFVDLDDCRMAPAIQDLWMLLSGDRRNMTLGLSDILEGYQNFCDFDPRELHLIEPLRTLRMIHYAAWLARRWTDPAFQHAFPWFNTDRYWEDHVLSLREQAAALQEPALSIQGI